MAVTGAGSFPPPGSLPKQTGYIPPLQAADTFEAETITVSVKRTPTKRLECKGQTTNLGATQPRRHTGAEATSSADFLRCL